MTKQHFLTDDRAKIIALMAALVTSNINFEFYAPLPTLIVHIYNQDELDVMVQLSQVHGIRFQLWNV